MLVCVESNTPLIELDKYEPKVWISWISGLIKFSKFNLDTGSSLMKLNWLIVSTSRLTVLIPLTLGVKDNLNLLKVSELQTKYLVL